MLNTQKLLYVLPDLAYIAELLPDKKPYSFAIQSFKQVNGEFLNETEFIPENIVKLINKLDEGEEYFLVLPDFLFTNTIVSVQETSDSKIKEKLTSDTLPKLGLNDDSHLVETVVLNQLKGTTRVQLSAIEKSILSVFKVALAEKDIKIAGVAPLSWTIKSLVSLEPSISVLQLGTKLYTAQHYIGVDQTTTATLDHPENIIETIKTLKGAEPSIQTVYLCANSVVEDKLKDALSKILPVQQMAVKDANEKIPSYVSQIIVAAQRTLAIPDFSVPTFKLAKPTQEEKDQYAAILTAAGVASADDDEDEVSSEIPKPKISPVDDEDEEKDVEESKDSEDVAETEEEKKPAELPDMEDEEKPEDKDSDSKLDDADAATIASLAAGAGAVAASTAAKATDATPAVIVGDALSNDPVVESDHEEKEESINDESEEKEESTRDEVDISETPPVIVGVSKIDTTSSPVAHSPVASEADQDIDLKQFAQNGETAVESSSPAKPVIKNKSGAQHMMKMILITTGVFVLTVAIGVGVGLAILKFSGKEDAVAPPTVEVEQPTPTPVATSSATPTASASAELDKAKVSILVVNATTKAGYAGQMQTKLEGADFENVETGNAKGEYEEKGNFVYLKTENAALLAAIEEATDLEVTADDSAKAEDTAGEYDAVLVLAE